jgi:glycosyltransferase involved in cell wall biosynthesis
MSSHPRPIRCVVLPPVAAPYREPLFEALAAREELELTVVYQAAAQASWDVSAGWFTTEHAYPAEHLRSWQRARPGRTPIVWPRGLERELYKRKPDCVVAWEYGPTALRAFAWTRGNRRAHVIFSENTPAIAPHLGAKQARLHHFLAGHVEGGIAASSKARQRFIELGMRPDRATVALQSAMLDPIRAASQAHRGLAAVASGPPPSVLAVGRLVPDKNLGALIDAFARAAPDRAAKLEIVGTGFLEDELRARAQRLNVEVQFHGHLESAGMAALYARADIFALVSTFEPFGVAVREAAAAGLPIVCSQVAGAAGDVAIAGRNAILIDPADTAQISDALRRLIADPALRAQLGAESRRVDAETSGHDVQAWLDAITHATGLRR